MQTLADDIAAQMQGAVDELERAVELLNELRESERYAHIPHDEVVMMETRFQIALTALGNPLPATLEAAAKDERDYMDSLDAAADRASY